MQFPVDSVFDLRSLSFDALIQTSHGGNQSANAANNYVQTYSLPRNGIASMISQLDIRYKWTIHSKYSTVFICL